MGESLALEVAYLYLYAFLKFGVARNCHFNIINS
jgi:hypothetical protein